jgi:hypothetical protein
MHSYKVQTFKAPIIIITIMNKEEDWEVARQQSWIKSNSYITNVAPLTQLK